MILELPVVLAHRYEVVRLLGAGTFAVTYLANDLELNREVAVKLLRSEHAQDPESVARFEREARATESISHPNVVRVFDHQVTASGQFLVMEYVAGSDLKQKIREEGALAPERAVEIASGMLAGLEAIHEVGLVHRDVKPHNILVSPDGEVKLSDFSIARATTDTGLTRTGTTLGTASYMAPEQATGSKVGPAADLYAVGVVLFELITGQLPFTGNDSLEVLYQQVHQEPPRPTQITSAVPSGLEAIILKALSKQPGDRYASAADMASALRQTQSADQMTVPVAPAIPTASETAPMPARASAGPVPTGRSGAPQAATAKGRRRSALLPIPAAVLGLLGVIVVVVGAIALSGNGATDGEDASPITTGNNVSDDDQVGDETIPAEPAKPTATPIPDTSPGEPEQPVDEPAPEQPAEEVDTEDPAPEQPAEEAEPEPEPAVEENDPGNDDPPGPPDHAGQPGGNQGGGNDQTPPGQDDTNRQERESEREQRQAVREQKQEEQKQERQGGN